MSAVLRRVVLVGAPLGLAVALLRHPAGGNPIYEGVRDDVGSWFFVHASLLLFTPFLGIAAYILVRGLEGRAGTVSRVALVFFLVFYTAYEMTVGVGTAVLVEHANGLSAAEQTAVAGAIQAYNEHWLAADPSLALVAGSLGWIVAMVAAAVGFRRAGAGWPLTLLVGFSALFAVHPPPVGPTALVCFAAAAVLVERGRAGAAGVTRERLETRPLGQEA